MQSQKVRKPRNPQAGATVKCYQRVLAAASQRPLRVELRFRCCSCSVEAEVKRRRRVVVNFAVHRDACRLAARRSGHELDDLLVDGERVKVCVSAEIGCELPGQGVCRV